MTLDADKSLFTLRAGWLRAGVVAVVAAAVLWVAPARAQEPEREYKPSDVLADENSLRPAAQIDGRSNAALEYFRIWDSLSQAERTELGQAAGSVDHEKGKLTKEQRQICEKYRDYIGALERQAVVAECDWGVRFDVGWMALLPHLGYLRASARAIRLDVYRCIDDGSYAAAAERVAAILHMSTQMHSDEIMISSLVSVAICAFGVSVTDEMLKGNMLNPAAARTILNVVKAIPRGDLFGAAAALKQERAISVEWVRGRYKGPHAGFLFYRETAMWATEDVFTGCIMGLNESQLSADLDRFGRFFDAAALAWKAPDNIVKLRELSTEVWEGQYGLVARVMAPSIERVAMSINRERKELNRIEARLEAIVHPEDAPRPGAEGAPPGAGAGK